ncbi:MAG TPA: hypothetical protein VIW67_26845 [Terriglobales bacterium]
MLEDYYVKPSTLDRVRASWLAPQIEGCLASAGVVIAPKHNEADLSIQIAPG